MAYDVQDSSAAPWPRPIAHWTHTLALGVVLTLMALYGHARATPDAGSRLTRYGSSLVFEWLLLGAVVAGVYQRREFFTKALRGSPLTGAQSVALGFGVYVLASAAILAVAAALYFTPLGRARNPEVVLAMLPRTPLEWLLWACVSLTAGICEELIFRGYLQQQFTAWTRQPVLAILLASLAFGSVHLYEGAGAILPLAALAIVYGFVVRHFRGDLRAVIVAHTLQDFLVAVFVVLGSHLKHLAR